MRTGGYDLHKIPLFASLQAANMETLAKCLHPLELPSGAFLFHEGEEGNSLYLITAGEIEIIQAVGTDKERLIHLYREGDFLGEMSMFEPQGLRTASARARTPCRLLGLEHADFQALLQHQPALGYQMIRDLSLRAYWSDKRTIEELRQKNQALSKAYEALKTAQEQIIEKEKLEQELQVARRIQQSMLPSSLPEMEGFDFGALMLPARAVGGDLYDFIPPSRDRLGVLVGDVSDKGVPAALFMALCRSLLRAEAARSRDPAQVLRSVNRHPPRRANPADPAERDSVHLFKWRARRRKRRPRALWPRAPASLHSGIPRPARSGSLRTSSPGHPNLPRPDSPGRRHHPACY